MDFKVTEPELVREYGKGWKLYFTLDSACVESAKRMRDAERESVLRLSVTEWREGRSLNANAYFHSLVGKIAEALGSSNEKVKHDLVLDYGAQAYWDGSPAWINLPHGVEPESLGVKYAKWFNTIEVRGKTHECYIVFQETHKYDTKQFSRLLDGAIAEAKQLGIETLPPETLKAMMERYAQENESTADTADRKAESV